MSPALTGRIFTASATWEPFLWLVIGVPYICLMLFLCQSSVLQKSSPCLQFVSLLSSKDLWLTKSLNIYKLINILLYRIQRLGLPWWLRWQRFCLQCRRPGFDPWKREWQPTPVFLPGKSHGQRSLMGYSPWGRKRLGNSWVTNIHIDCLGALYGEIFLYWSSPIFPTKTFKLYSSSFFPYFPFTHMKLSFVWCKDPT